MHTQTPTPPYTPPTENTPPPSYTLPTENTPPPSYNRDNLNLPGASETNTSLEQPPAYESVKITLDDNEIQGFNEIFRRDDIYFSSYKQNSEEIYLSICFNLAKSGDINIDNNADNLSKWRAKYSGKFYFLFKKFQGDNTKGNYTQSTYGKCAPQPVDSSIMDRFPLDVPLDKITLYQRFKNLIETSQHNQLIKEEDVKNLNDSYGKKSYKPGETPNRNINNSQEIPRDDINANNRVDAPEQPETNKPNTKFKLSSITEWFKKAINSVIEFISACMPCCNKNKK